MHDQYHVPSLGCFVHYLMRWNRCLSVASSRSRDGEGTEGRGAAFSYFHCQPTVKTGALDGGGPEDTYSCVHCFTTVNESIHLRRQERTRSRGDPRNTRHSYTLLSAPHSHLYIYIYMCVLSPQNTFFLVEAKTSACRPLLAIQKGAALLLPFHETIPCHLPHPPATWPPRPAEMPPLAEARRPPRGRRASPLSPLEVFSRGHRSRRRRPPPPPPPPPISPKPALSSGSPPSLPGYFQAGAFHASEETTTYTYSVMDGLESKKRKSRESNEAPIFSGAPIQKAAPTKSFLWCIQISC